MQMGKKIKDLRILTTTSSEDPQWNPMYVTADSHYFSSFWGAPDTTTRPLPEI